MQIGIAGELRCVVTKADGDIKIDTGFQKNLILNQGLEFFGGDKGSSLNAYCAIGAGNSTPEITQTGLDAYIKQASGTDTTSDYSYTDLGDGLYRIWEQKKYRFDGLSDVNISELGLVSTGTSASNYYLTTRALIKDTAGNPTSISLKLGETLDIYYKVHKVIDLSEKHYLVDMLDGAGGSVPFNVVLKPINVGNRAYYRVAERLDVYHNGNNVRFYVSDGELGSVYSSPTINESFTSELMTLRPYEPHSYKRVLDIGLGLNDGNKSEIRSVSLTTGFADWTPFKFLPFQLRFGRVSDDAAINKTVKDILTIPLEVSWGRYEGEL